MDNTDNVFEFPDLKKRDISAEIYQPSAGWREEWMARVPELFSEYERQFNIKADIWDVVDRAYFCAWLRSEAEGRFDLCYRFLMGNQRGKSRDEVKELAESMLKEFEVEE